MTNVNSNYTVNILTKKCNFLLISLLKMNVEIISDKIASQISKDEKEKQ